MFERLLIRLAEVYVNVLHFGEDKKYVRLHILGEPLGREVLVYHRGDSGERTVHIFDDRYAAAARRDDYRRIPQAFHRIELDDPLRLRRGHHPAPTAPRVLFHRPALLLRELLRLLRGVEASYRLSRVLERRVAVVDDDLRDDSDDGNVAILVAEGVAQALLNLIADIPLRHSAAAVEGNGGELIRLRGRGDLLLKDEAPHLRAVSVDYGHLKAAAADIREILASLFYDAELLLRGRRRPRLHQRVSAESYNYFRSVGNICFRNYRVGNHGLALLHIKIYCQATFCSAIINLLAQKVQ